MKCNPLRFPTRVGLGLGASLLVLVCGCQPDEDTGPHYASGQPRQSQSLVLSADGTRLVVVNPDADSISVIDPGARKLLGELPLGPRPVLDSAGRFEPHHGPRSVDLSPDGRLAYVACQLSGQLLTVEVATGALRGTLPIGAEPVSVLVHPGGAALYVAAYQAGEVVRIGLGPDGLPDEAQVSRARTTDRPWGLGLDAGGQALYATRFLLQPGVDVLDPQTLALRAGGAAGAIEEVAPRGNKLLAHGAPRGVYGAAVRPGGAREVWLPHLLLATDVAQPELDFESTVFPALSIRDTAGAAITFLSVDSRLPKVDGAFADIVSGPRAIAFTPDGSLALTVDMSSEDVLVVDAERRVQTDLVRPLPGDLPEGIVVSADGRFAYVDERASSDIAVLAIAPDWKTRATGKVTVDGAPIPRLASTDPMPAQMRLGQRLFYSANSAEFPITQNFWVACASCHLEGRSDAVTWLFSQGPRDTPSNAGGTRGTGFLLRQASRNDLAQYDETIRIEQGGDFDLKRPGDKKLLDAIAAYVDGAIPLPRSPEIDVRTGRPSAAAERGRALFSSTGCATCHTGPLFTDSGAGNPQLDLSGKTAPVVLYDVDTCARAGQAAFPDRDVLAYDGSPRSACAFDTPSLRGIADTAPYLHDGSAATLEQVVDHFTDYLKRPRLSAADRADLVAYLRSL